MLHTYAIKLSTRAMPMTKIEKIIDSTLYFPDFPNKRTSKSTKRYIRVSGVLLNFIFYIPGLIIFTLAYYLLSPINEIVKVWDIEDYCHDTKLTHHNNHHDLIKKD